MKVYEAIANAFIKEGTRAIFGLLGDAQIGWWSEMAKHPGMKIVDARHEGASLSMAEGWGRVTEEVGVCSVTQGPGVSHLASSLIDSSKGGFPIVIYAGSPPVNGDEQNPQYLDQGPFVKSTGAGYIEVLKPDFAEEAVRQAFYRAKTEMRPIMLAVPKDMHSKPCDADGDEYEPSSTLFNGLQRIRPDLERLKAAAKIIAASKKPVVLVGRGAMTSDAGEAAAKLAERIGALITTTLPTKGFLGESEYHCGISGIFASKTVMGYCGEADCVVAIGAGLNRNTIAGGYFYPNAAVVHIDIQPHIVMGNRQSAEHYIQGDAEATLKELEALLDAQGVKQKVGFRTPEVREALSGKFRDTQKFEIEPGTVDPREVVKIIDEQMPLDIGVVYGGGHQKAFPVQMMNRLRRQIYASFFGCIGQALPTAIGSAVGLNKPLVVIEGDGGALQNIQELDTAARLGLKILYVILNDESYGTEYQKLVAKGMNREISVVRSPDLGAVGRGFGCRGRLARNLDDVLKGAQEFLAGDGPMVLDVRTSRSVISIPLRRTLYAQDV